MHIAVVPASSQTGKATIRVLLNDQQVAPTVQGVYRNLSKVPSEFTCHTNFRSVQGNIGDVTTLDFSGIDAVFLTPPPCYDGSDSVEFTRSVCNNVKAAIQKSGTVKRLVLLSSVGAQLPSGTGEIVTNHTAETILRDAAPEVVFVRCAYFMENWATVLETIKSEHPFFFSTITPLDYKVNMVAVKDIAQSVAAQLLATSSPQTLPESPYIYELYGPRLYTPRDVQAAFQQAAGKDVEIKPVEKSELREFFGKVLPPSLADGFTEMTVSFLPGGVMTQDVLDKFNPIVKRGKTELVEVIGELYRG
ncbi:hypothetical protein EYZ11_012550 [Aspergillus tanneri]|uniref:NAD(P)-binding domain-containing protein n=1 Tax=Aspergillus tanneri TaxID=1220188 RepID=A0A4S3J088_9EURO|nr:uncharacterized protein ATNIH1004_008410 [Aspergillus tanneri]KAA8644211.1 hypothetical protein ATNIH1004_008410 [Aspergillus tanneri]THC88005.1 hypothetical protein EYZ11_012550 [Aspergillus tanneri]